MFNDVVFTTLVTLEASPVIRSSWDHTAEDGPRCIAERATFFFAGFSH